MNFKVSKYKGEVRPFFEAPRHRRGAFCLQPSPLPPSHTLPLILLLAGKEKQA